MLLELKLTNFKKHESLHVNFSEGLVAIKGANEAGKSTLFHAIVYAFFGSRALPMTLAETVTYDKPESSLRVELAFRFEGTDYRINRAKSGATLVSTHGTVNGQAEVTKYVEGLFGVSADSSSKLMIASQNGLRGALESNDAISLIEKLADIGVVDDLISRIQKQLPCGNTSLIVESLESYRDLAAPVFSADDEEATVTLAKSAVEDLEKSLAKSPAPSQQEYDAAQKEIDSYNEAVSRRRHLQEHIRTLTEYSEKALVKPDASRIPVIEAEIAEEKLQTAKRSAYRDFNNFKQPVVTYIEGDLTEVSQALEKTRAAILQNTKAQAGAEAALIKESHCGLCGKDLTEVPEVVSKNAELTEKARIAEANLTDLYRLLTELQEKQEQLLFVGNEISRVMLAHARLPDHTKIENNGLTLAWVGGAPLAAGDKPDYKAELAALNSALQKYDTEVAVREGYKSQLVETMKAEAAVVVNHKSYDMAVAKLAELDTATKNRGVILSSLNSAKAALMSAEHKLQLKKSDYQHQLAEYEKSLAAKAKLEGQLALMNKHNALIRKLRELRPKIAAELWSIVLASVSSHFSAIRGTPSVVTRSADGFLVDGRPVKGLSGSTLDSLGLAIRVALNKTFLPSIQFLLLDEPAAGMSDEREAAMLGLLAGINYKQVMVITHSNLADTFANGIVQV